MNIKYVVFITLAFVVIVGFMNLNVGGSNSKATQEKTDKTKKNEDQTIYTIPEKPAEPIGGLQALSQYITKNLRYPELARRTGIEGRVFVEFVVEKNGSVSQLKVIKGIDKACDREALRVIGGFTKWQPGKHQGKTVRVRRSFPVLFKL
ncbi:hypothetical protein BKI52_09895 [marine bacterium AO1-C]|nr:hypothetical protein BKI52_09895 [marine bacterium AO1-C]